MFEIIRECIFCPEHGLIAMIPKYWPLVTASVAYILCAVKSFKA